MADLSCESSGDLPLSPLSKNPFLSPGNPARKKRFPPSQWRKISDFISWRVYLLTPRDGQAGDKVY